MAVGVDDITSQGVDTPPRDQRAPRVRGVRLKEREQAPSFFEVGVQRCAVFDSQVMVGRGGDDQRRVVGDAGLLDEVQDAHPVAVAFQTSERETQRLWGVGVVLLGQVPRGVAVQHVDGLLAETEHYQKGGEEVLLGVGRPHDRLADAGRGVLEHHCGPLRNVLVVGDVGEPLRVYDPVGEPPVRPPLELAQVVHYPPGGERFEGRHRAGVVDDERRRLYGLVEPFREDVQRLGSESVLLACGEVRRYVAGRHDVVEERHDGGERQHRHERYELVPLRAARHPVTGGA